MSADGRAFLAVTLPFAWMNLINQASRTVMAVRAASAACTRRGPNQSIATPPGSCTSA